MSRQTVRYFASTPARALVLGIAAIVLLGVAIRSGRAANDGQLALTVVDEKTKQPIACRMHLVGPGKRPRQVKTVPFWSDHFVFPGKITLNLPVGDYTFEIERGPEYLNREGNFRIEQFADDTKEVPLKRFADISAEGWWSGDLFVRRPARDAELLMLADDLHVAEFVTWWNDKSDWVRKSPPKKPIVNFEQNRWYDALAGGYSRPGIELLCFHLPTPELLPRPKQDYPSIVEQLIKLREKNPKLWVDVAQANSWDLPMLIAHGQVDSIQVINNHFCRTVMQDGEAGGKPRETDRYPGPMGYARWNQDIYFKLLECGVRIPPTAGSGSGVTPNPVGYNRVYVHLDSSFDYDQWWNNLRAGQVVVTNGPLLRPTVGGRLPGHTFQGEPGKELELEIGLTLSTCDPIRYLDIIQDGMVRHTIRFEDYAKTGRLPKLKFKQSGWFILRAVTANSDTYRFAMTGPYFVEFDGKPRISKQAAQFFVDWVYQRAKQIKVDDPDKRSAVMALHRKARDFWADILAKANAE